MAGQVPDGSPTVRGRRLAAELRRLRERTGLTGDEVAHQLGWSGSKVSRIETHRTGVKPGDLRRLLDLYRIGGTYRDELVALARESRRKGWLETFTANFPPEIAAYISAEAEATSSWNWEPQVVPGLLQTTEYARALFSDWMLMFPGPSADIERRLEARVLRQEVLTRDDPLLLTAVMDESVLRRRFGDTSVMRGQLERLLEASEQPNVAIHVLPLDGGHPFATSAFAYLKFPPVRDRDLPLSDIVWVDHFDGVYYVEDDVAVFRYHVAFEHLVGRSLAPRESRDLIGAVLRQVWA